MNRFRPIRAAFILVLLVIFLLPVAAYPQRILRVGVDSSLPPFSFIDAESNSIRGFDIDLAKLLVANLEARLRLFPAKSSELEERLYDGKVDLIISEKIPSARLQSLELPLQVERKLFVNNSCVTVTCVRDLPGISAIVLKGSDLRTLVPSWEKVKFIEAETQEKALQLLNAGEAQAYISPNGRAAIYTIQKNNLRNIKEVGMPVESVPLTVSVRADNTQLLTELSVAFGKIVENGSFDTIHKKWFGHEIEFADLEKYIKFGSGAAGLLALMLLGFIIWNRTLKREVRRVTHDLKLSEQKHRDLIEFSPEMIHLIAPDGRIMHANKIVLQRLGYSLEEVCSKGIGDLVAPEKKAEIENFIESIFTTAAGTREFSLCSKSGRMIDVEMSATVVRGPDTVLACCFSRDITERKRLEEELIQSERLAIMGEMAAGIAHEINNPLGIILANTEELLQQKFDDGDTKDSLEAIERNALRAGKFIDDLLTFTRPTPPAKVRIDLTGLVEESLSLCKQQLKQKQVRIEKSFPAGPLFFEGDDSQIQQVMINLILNAVQAMPQKGTITIRAGHERNNGTQLIHLEIADSGTGIPEKDLAKIFDPFYTARKNKGFGLGLSISKRIIDKHNGTIRVESEAGRGTVIFIDLPFCPPPDAPPAAQKERSIG